MELLLIRHAQPVRIEGADGAADPHLTPAGVEQAVACARWVAAEGLDAVVTSPLRRAVETAAPIAEMCDLAVDVVDELAEFDRSADTYIPVEELKAADDPRWHALITDRWADLAGIDPDVFRTRVVDAIERIIEAHPGGRVAAVCHGGVINMYFAHILGLDRDLWFEPAYTSISRVTASRTGVRSVGSLNETGHLRVAEPID